MATSAFKSTTKRMSIGASTTQLPHDSASTNRNSVHRRSRSLSRFSHRIPSSNASENFDEAPAPRGRFVNTERGSGFPEISLDDLAIEFFSSGDRGRSASKNSEPSPGSGGSASQRRGRSVSRQSSRVNGGASDTNGTVYSSNAKKVSDNTPRRRRSVSVVRYQISDSESDLEQSQNFGMRANQRNFGGRNNQMPVSSKSYASNNKPVLRRSLTQKDLLLQDGYSSHSSILTDEEGRDGSLINNKLEKTLQAIYSKTKGEHITGDNVSGEFPEAMRKEVRHAVEEMRMELEQAIMKRKSSISPSNSLQCKNSVHSMRENYSSKLEQSEKRKKDLMAEIMLEQQRGQELSKIVEGLHPNPKNIIEEQPSRVRKKSNDRSRMSTRLTEEAEKYISDFISNVEDTDISSIDGERSDTSSSLGGILKIDAYQSPVPSNSIPVDMDDVLLPWLKWETSYGSPSPLSCKNKTEPCATPQTSQWAVNNKKSNSMRSQSNHSISSHGSWSPGMAVTTTTTTNASESIFEEINKFQKKSSIHVAVTPVFDMDAFEKLQSDEKFILERWQQRHRIKSGGLLLCHQRFF